MCHLGMFYIDYFYKPQNSSLKLLLLWVWTLISGRMVIITQHFSFAVTSPRPPAEGFRGRRRMDGVLLWCSGTVMVVEVATFPVWDKYKGPLRMSRWDSTQLSGWPSVLADYPVSYYLIINKVLRKQMLTVWAIVPSVGNWLGPKEYQSTRVEKPSDENFYIPSLLREEQLYTGFHTNREMCWVSWARGLKRLFSQPLPSNARS